MSHVSVFKNVILFLALYLHESYGDGDLETYLNEKLNQSRVKKCYRCEGYCDKPVVQTCGGKKRHHNKKYGCIILSVTDIEQDALDAVGKHAANVTFLARGYYEYKGCWALNKMTLKNCSEVDRLHGSTCLICIKDLCNWTTNKSPENSSSLFTLLPTFLAYVFLNRG